MCGTQLLFDIYFCITIHADFGCFAKINMLILILQCYPWPWYTCFPPLSHRTELSDNNRHWPHSSHSTETWRRTRRAPGCSASGSASSWSSWSGPSPWPQSSSSRGWRAAPASPSSASPFSSPPFYSSYRERYLDNTLNNNDQILSPTLGKGYQGGSNRGAEAANWQYVHLEDDDGRYLRRLLPPRRHLGHCGLWDAHRQARHHQEQLKW